MCFSPSTSVVSSVGMVPLEDLYQLNQYLQVRSTPFSVCLFVHVLLYSSVIWRAAGCNVSFWSQWPVEGSFGSFYILMACHLRLACKNSVCVLYFCIRMVENVIQRV